MLRRYSIMSKKLNWLDSFAETQAAKMTKTASLNKKAEQIIVDPEEIPGAIDGKEVTYKDRKYTVVNAAYSDEIGNGIVLEASEEDKKVNAGLEDLNLEKEEVSVEETVPAEVINEVPATVGPMDAPMTMEMGLPTGTTTMPAGSMGAQEYHYTNPGDVYSIGDVRDQVEVQKFQGEATETEQAISQENAIDRTVPEGKYSTNRIINRIVDSVIPEVAPVTEIAPAVDEFVEEELPELDTPVEDAPAVVEEVDETIEPIETVENEEAVEEVEEVDEKEDEKEDEKPLLATNNSILKRILSLK
jgi:hypothetical protein